MDEVTRAGSVVVESAQGLGGGVSDMMSNTLESDCSQFVVRGAARLSATKV